LPVRCASASSASASRAISVADRKRSIFRTGAFLTPSAGRVGGTEAALDSERKIALTDITHCAATPLPPLVRVPDRRVSPGLEFPGQLSGRIRVAHAFDVGARHAVDPQRAEKRPEVMLEAAALDPQRRGLFVADAFGEVEIDL
jgi:hypothetical protein